MQIDFSATRLDLGIHQSTQTDAERRKVRRIHFRVGDQRKVTFEFLRILGHEFGDRLASNLFLAFEQELYIDRQSAATTLHKGLKSLQMHEHLSLVVHSAPRIEVLIALRGLKRRSSPLVQWIGRLDIVVAVAKSSWLGGSVQPIRIDQRMPCGPDDLNVLQSDRAHLCCEKFRGALNISLVLR